MEISLRELDAEKLDRLMEHPRPESFILKINSKKFLFSMEPFLRPTATRLENGISAARNAIRRIISSYYNDLATRTHALSTIETNHRGNMQFISWANENNHSNIFISESEARTALVNYISYLQHTERTGQFKRSSVARLQTAAIDTLKCAYDGNISLQGVQLISTAGNINHSTPLPDKENLAKALKLSSALFNGISDFLLNQENYPFQLKLPQEACWVFPARIWIMPEFREISREQMRNSGWVWNYQNGTINSLEYLSTKYTAAPSSIQKQINKAELLLQRANTDKNHSSRLNLGNLAVRAFLFLFNSITAANRQFYINLNWDNDYFFSKGRKKHGIDFIDIKKRASRTVKFSITKEFLPYFEKYLKLRSYLIGSSSFDRLFIQLGKDYKPSEISESTHKRYFEQVNGLLDPTIASINFRELRAYKGDHHQNMYSAYTTSEALQNSPATSLRYYATGSESRQSLELTDFYAHIANRVHQEEERLASSLEQISMGACASIGHPEAALEPTTIHPDCKSPEGCLYCKNLRIHADRHDIHKLLSMRFVINELGSLIYEEKYFKEELQETLDIIDKLLLEIANKGQNLKPAIEEISNLVENGNLTSYWEWKLNQLIELGVLS